MHIPTALEICTDLRDWFHQSNAPRIFQIKKLLSVLQQGSMDVNVCYTKLRTLWDELKDFQQVSLCNCGSMKEWIDDQNQECVMQFLMGLNDSYAQIRAQILMMDQIPVISKIFSLVVQEERQRSIHKDVEAGPSGSSFDQLLLTQQSFNVVVVKDNQYAKGDLSDKPVSSNCHIKGHTIEKCYKIHGYLIGHPKYKKRQLGGGRQIHASSAALTSFTAPVSSMANSLNPDQFRHLIAFLSSQLQLGHSSTLATQQPEPSISCFSGTSHGQDDWDR